MKTQHDRLIEILKRVTNTYKQNRSLKDELMDELCEVEEAYETEFQSAQMPGSTVDRVADEGGSKNGVWDIVKVGNKIRIFYGGKNINNKLIHIVAIVDDDEIVYKTWLKHKKYWSYKCENVYYFDTLYNENILHLVG